MDALAIAKAVMEQRPIRVTDEIDVGDRTRRVLNPTETAAAQEKADALQERFGSGAGSSPSGRARLPREYNRRFNSLVLRDYTTAGAQLTLPGLTRTFTPRAHQRAAVARIVAEPAVGLFHEVGAGKTAEMAIGAMELRRLGLVRKPAVVVPNHMLEQFSREWLQLYPQARVLAASGEDLAGERRRAVRRPGRRERLGRGHHDPLARSSGSPVSPDTEAAYARAGGRAAARDARARAGRPRADREADREARSLAREQKLKAAPRRAARPGHHASSRPGSTTCSSTRRTSYKNLQTDVEHPRRGDRPAQSAPPTCT